MTENDGTIDDPDREARDALWRLHAELGAHVFMGEVFADGSYVETYTGAGLHDIVGSLPEGVEMGDAWLEAIHPDDRDAVLAAQRRLYHGEPMHHEYRIYDDDGELRWLLERCLPRRRPDGRVLLDGLVSDVTELRRAAAEHEHTAEQLKAMVESSDDFYFCIEVEDGPDGQDERPHFAGPGIERILGGALPPGREWLEFGYSRLAPDARDALDDAVVRARREPTQLEVRLRGLDDEWRWVWLRLKPRPQDGGRILIDAVATDVSERHRARAALAETREQLELVLSSMDELLYTGTLGDDASWRVISAGQAWDEIFDPMRIAAAFDDVWAAAVHPEDYEFWLEGDHMLARGEPISQEYRLLDREGNVRWVLDRARPRVGGDGGTVVDGILIDVSNERRAAIELMEAREQIEHIASNIEEVLYTVELTPAGERRMRYAGASAERLLGDLPLDELAARWHEMVHPDDRAAVEASGSDLLAGRPVELEYRLTGPAGARWILDRVRPRARRGETVVCDGILIDITARRRAADELGAARDSAERLSRVDPLCGVYNRRHFGNVLAHELERVANGPETPAVLLLDIDHFKQLNDRFGHQAGDRVLTAFAELIGGAVRPYDCIARWGGEEFAVLLPHVHDDAALREHAERLRRTIADRPIPARGELHAVTASIGAVRAAGDGWTPEMLMDAADRALYAAKRRGRNQSLLYAELSAEDLSEEPEAVRIAQALALASSVREGMPRVHAEQVADLAARTARALGLTATAQDRCRLGGWLHDVGKVAIPDRILAKPGALDAEEWSVMRSHTLVGEQVVRRVPDLADAAAAVRSHHERYDGTGYPDGLAGEEIPIEARIVAAADAYSVITAERVYQTARSHADALAELERSAGTHLDPAVVDAIRSVLREPAAHGPSGRRGPLPPAVDASAA